MAGKAKTDQAVKLRQDFFVYNEATAFLITSKKTCGTGMESGSEAWNAAVLEGKLIPVELYQDDPFILRLVLKDKLTPQEGQEWLGKLSHHIRVEDGKLIIAAGVEYILEQMPEDDAWFREYSHTVDVPPGHYHADLYTYINSVNGEPLLAIAETKPEPIGKYYRRTRKNRAFPSWLKQWCASYPDIDPKHEDEWQDADFDSEDEPFVSFLLHLTPISEAAPETITQPSEDGFFKCSQNTAQKPEKCPLGLLGEDVLNLPAAAPPVPPPPVEGVEIFSRVSSRQMHKLDSPVELPISKLVHAYILAWYCTDSAHPELLLEGEIADKLPPDVLLDDRLQLVSIEKPTTCVRTEDDDGRWTTIAKMKKLSNLISSMPDPAITRMELCTATDNEKSENHDSEGLLRFSGPVRDGIWQIEETYPKLSSETLRQALSIAEQAELGQSITFADPEIAAHAVWLFEAEWAAIFRDKLPVLNGNTVTMKEVDSSLAHLLALFYFKEHFGASFPVRPIEPELIEKAERLRKRADLSRDILLQGDGRTYTATSINTLKPEAIEDCGKTDAEMKQLGATLIGDLACSAFPDMVLRYYAMPDGVTRLVWMRKDSNFGASMIQIISDFKDDAILFSSTGPMKIDEPKRKLFRLSHQTKSLAELYAKHTERMQELKAKHKGLKPFEPTLLECAIRLEKGIIQQS